MSTYEVRIPFRTEAFAVVKVDADDPEQAEDRAFEAALGTAWTVDFEADFVIHEDITVKEETDE